ncbi:MAG: N-formylglutamate amidohydrolase, partial [Rhodospirillaceae bacterium]|nr:N-formylglutamate amidohydrolase [Rhodospirillaceae bacterium]
MERGQKPRGVEKNVSGTVLSERIPGVLEILHPDVQSLPIVLASPHSGCAYTPAFLASSRLGPMAIRKSEDAFVDRLFENGPKHGAPLIHALFPRAFLDVNREAYELDPNMFEDPLPAFVNMISPRASVGLGTVPRIVGYNQPIYNGKLLFSDAQDRIETLYYPYHTRLRSLIHDTVQQFGTCILLDCHSMPTGFPESMVGTSGPNIVLGDAFGSTCDAIVSDTAERVLSNLGYIVARNRPYAGGFTTRHYGRPALGTHALQIEIARHLYMNESKMAPLPALTHIAEDMMTLV